MSHRVAIATCRELPKGDEDAPLLDAALRAAGIEPVLAVWNDARVDWDAFSLTVLRSTWDYTDDRDGFVSWARSVPRLLNPPRVVEWNTDKSYLRDLAGAGVPVVSTALLSPGDAFAAPDATEWVVKPAISAGSRDTTRFSAGDEEKAAAEVARMHADGRTVMVQPFVASVDDRGETAVLFLGGAFSHSIVKGPMLTPDRPFVDRLYYEEDIAPRGATEAERAVAALALEAVPGGPDQLLYARVDVVEGAAGPEVLELELTEPSMFLAHAEGAADRFAAAVRAALEAA